MAIAISLLLDQGPEIKTLLPVETSRFILISFEYLTSMKKQTLTPMKPTDSWEDITVLFISNTNYFM